jgi:hypothetical protein
MAFNQSGELAGLNTYTISVPTAGAYSIDWKNYLSRLAQGGSPSSLVTTINQNGSPVFTSTAGSDGGHYDLSCSAGDTITLVTSSSAPVDETLNNVKTQVAFSGGQ